MPYLDPLGDKSPRSPDSLLWPEPLGPTQTRPMLSRIWTGARLGRLCVALGVISLASLGTLYLALTLRNAPELLHTPIHTLTETSQSDFTDNSQLLKSRNATSRFRDNLSSSPEHKFITAWPSSGWTNDVIAAINLIYMATLTQRTPIIPPFTPSHVGTIDRVGPLRFGDIFDVPRLANELGMHILEWHELKHSVLDARESGAESEAEKLGCWSAWSMSPTAGGRARHSEATGLYNLDISYTPVSKSFTLSKGFQKDQYYLSIWSLASLGYPETRNEALESQASQTFPLESGADERLVPDDKMLCFDLLYYIGLTKEEEWWRDYAPFWRTVGTHLHWTPKLVEIAEGYLRHHFNLADGETMPPFISLHVRRTDFAGWCPPNMNKEACFATPETYARRVREIRASLRARPDAIDAHLVLVTSDERDPAWWKEIAELGPEWRRIDHAAEKTVEKYGKWYPVILDAVFQSMGTGFVGTDRSTMTLLSQRRVEDWNGGFSAAVRWGTPDADNH